MSFVIKRKTVNDAGSVFTNRYYWDGSIDNVNEANGAIAAGEQTGSTVGEMVLDCNGERLTVGEQESATQDWWTYGFDDSTAAAGQYVKAFGPPEFEGLGFKDATLTRVREDKWKVGIIFSNSEPQSPTVAKINVSTTGETTVVKIARNHKTTVYRTGASGDPNPHKGAINVSRIDGKRQVEGITVPTRSMQFDIETFYQPSDVDLAFWNAIYLLTATVNNAPFMGFPAGTLLYLGGDGGGDSMSLVSIVHSFVAIPNETNLVVGGLPPIPTKLGHEYFWAEFEQSADADQLVVEPFAGHVEEIFPAVSWAALQIPS